VTTTLWSRYLLVTAVIGGVAVVVTWPYARLFADVVLGDGSDVPMAARELWALDFQGGDPFTTARDFLLAAPDGVEVLRAANLANILFTAPVWGLGQLIGFAEAFNVYAFAALVLSGTAAFILLDRLRFGVLAATFGAYVFTFNPNHLDKVFGHAPLAATGILPLVVLALLARRRRPTPLRAAGAGLLLAVAFYINTYLGLFAFFVAAVFAGTEYVLRPRETSRYELVRSYYFLALAFVLGLVPLGVSWYVDPSSVASLAAARTGVFPGGSAEPQLYLLPGPRHPVLGGPMSEWLETNLSWEYTMFFGYTTIALAVAGVILAFVRHQRGVLTPEARFIVAFAAALAVVGLWASLPPKVQVGEFVMLALYTAAALAAFAFGEPLLRRRWRWNPLNVSKPLALLAVAVVVSTTWILLPSTLRTGAFEVPTPSYLIREATTLYRVFSRFGVLVGLGLILLAAYALSSLPWSRYRPAIAATALVLVAFELYVGPPKVVAVQDLETAVTVKDLAESASSRPIIMDISKPPTYLAWLRRQPPGIVADYPYPLTPHDRWAWKDVFYQQFHEHALWQGDPLADRSVGALNEFADDLRMPLAARALAVAGVRYVVVHRDRYRELGLSAPATPCGLERLASFPADGVVVYEEKAVADQGFAVRDDGFYPVANRDVWPEDRGFRWMPEQSEVVVYSPRTERVFLSGTAASLGRARDLLVFDSSGEQVGAWRIEELESAFRFALPVRDGINRFVLVARPGPVRRDGDPRLRAVAVSSLTVAPIGRENAAPEQTASASACR
jgi:hypothetical protein